MTEFVVHVFYTCMTNLNTCFTRVDTFFTHTRVDTFFTHTRVNMCMTVFCVWMMRPAGRASETGVDEQGVHRLCSGRRPWGSLSRAWEALTNQVGFSVLLLLASLLL